MPKVFCTGLVSKAFFEKSIEKVEDCGPLTVTGKFLPLPIISDNDNIEIGWDYAVIWNNRTIRLLGKLSSKNLESSDKLLCNLQNQNISIKQVCTGSGKIIVLTDQDEIWIHNIFSEDWQKIPKNNLVPSLESNHNTISIVKIRQSRCTVALTSDGRLINVPLLVNNTYSVKFVDVACGFDHTVLLAENGDVYSMGMGTRGQTGHGDLEDCDEPRLIEALAGLKVIGISAGGWHTAVVTDQGDLYTWGWNKHGELGQPQVQNVSAVPTIVDFTNDDEETIELNVVKAQCGNNFTICMTDTGEFWGCGSNKFCQLGMPLKKLTSTNKFVKLECGEVDGYKIVDFKCNEWNFCIYTSS